MTHGLLAAWGLTSHIISRPFCSFLPSFPSLARIRQQWQKSFLLERSQWRLHHNRTRGKLLHEGQRWMWYSPNMRGRVWKSQSAFSSKEIFFCHFIFVSRIWKWNYMCNLCADILALCQLVRIWCQTALEQQKRNGEWGWVVFYSSLRCWFWQFIALSVFPQGLQENVEGWEEEGNLVSNAHQII